MCTEVVGCPRWKSADLDEGALTLIAHAPGKDSSCHACIKFHCALVWWKKVSTPKQDNMQGQKKKAKPKPKRWLR